MKRIAYSVLAFSLLTSLTFASDPRCKPRSEMLDLLKGSRFKESVFATGRLSKNVIVEFFVNPVTKTFTVLGTVVISKDDNGKIAGRSCIIAGGSEFQTHEPDPTPKPSKHTMLFWQLQ